MTTSSPDPEAGRVPFLDKTHPDVYQAFVKASLQSRAAARAAGLDRALVELVCVRVSQLNGCSRCLSVHVPAARSAGVPQRTLDLLPTWRESDGFDAGQRAALGLAESLCQLDESLAATRRTALQLLGEEKATALEWAIVTIDTFNRISIASGHPPLPYDA